MIRQWLSRQFIVVAVSLLVSSCGPGQLFGPTITPSPTPTLTPTITPTPTLTPTPTITPSPTITPTPTPAAATFDDSLCDIKGSFTLNGTLSLLTITLVDVVENEPRYALSVYGYSKDSKSHVMYVWIKHTASPGPNEMEDLRENYNVKKVNIYSADNTAFHADETSVQLTLHAIPVVQPVPTEFLSSLISSGFYTCDFVVEQIQLK